MPTLIQRMWGGPVKALWFGCRWNLRIDMWHASSSFQLVQNVINPPTTVMPIDIIKESDF